MGLVLTENETTQLALALTELLKQSDGKCALLVDQNGRCLARRGFTRSLDCDALAALLAGSFASTRAIAKLVGESEFTLLFHQGQNDHIHNILVDEDTILSVIFDDRTTVGMVRLCSKEIAKRLRIILSEARCRIPETLDAGASRQAAEEAKERIDNIFQEE